MSFSRSTSSTCSWTDWGFMNSENEDSIQFGTSPASSPIDEKESQFGGSWSSSISSISSLSSTETDEEFFPSNGRCCSTPQPLHHNNVAGVLECSNCKDLASPPIYICARGHHVCSKCRPLLTVCPAILCDAPMTSTRNMGLEQLATMCLKSCCYASEGCFKMLPQEYLSSHQSECDFKPYSCPYLLCRKQMAGKDIHSHLERLHGLYPYEGESITLTFALPRCWNSPNKRRGSSAVFREKQHMAVVPTTDWIADPQLITDHGHTFIAKLARTRGRFGNGDALWVFWLWINTSRKDALHFSYEATLHSTNQQSLVVPLAWRAHPVSLRASMTEVMIGNDVITLTDAMLNAGDSSLEPNPMGQSLSLKLHITTNNN